MARDLPHWIRSMTGLQSRSRIEHEFSRTTNRQNSLQWFARWSCRRGTRTTRGSDTEERDDLVNDAG